MHDKNFIQVAGNTRTDYFDVRRQTRKDGLPIMLPMRNKVLSVLLAAGMVASMPAATAFNVMADDAVAVESTADEGSLVGENSTNYKNPKWSIVTDNPLTNETENNENGFLVLDLEHNKDTNQDVKFVINLTDAKHPVNGIFANGGTSLTVKGASEKTDDSSYRVGDITVSTVKSATCSNAGSESVKATINFDDHDWSYNNDNVPTKQLEHNWEVETGTWTWTKSTEKYDNGANVWSATYTMKCAAGNETQVINATVDAEGVNNATCSYEGAEAYRASFTFNNKTYYCDLNTKTVNGSTQPSSSAKTFTFGAKVNTDTGDAKDFAGTKLDAYVSGNTVVENQYSAHDFTAPIEKLNHDWNYSSAKWTWNENNDKTKAADYYDGRTDKDGKKVDESKWTYNYLKNAAYNGTWNKADHYLYSKTQDNTVVSNTYYSKVSDVKAAVKDTNSTVKVFVKGLQDAQSWEKDVVYVELTCNRKNNTHYSNEQGKQYDGPSTVYVPAFVVAEAHDAGDTTDAYVTYTAYVFYDKAAAKAEDIALFGEKADGSAKQTAAEDFYDAFQVGTDGVSYAHAYGKNFVDTKTDTWKGSAKGHDFFVAGWTWSNDFSYVTINLGCNKYDILTTVQSSKVKKNADGSATVVYTAKDARKYYPTTTDHRWDGKDGYYLDQSKNPYGKEYTVNGLPLKNAGVVNNGKIVMTRLYNKTTGEHLYTSDANEIKTLVNEYNWTNEGTAWNAPAVSNTPVYRMFNRVTGEHVYTKDLNEVNTLSKKDEWNNEGIAWYSDDNKTVPVYRQFNPKAATSKASHNYTTSTNEKKTLTSQYGWNDEGIGWYGV